MEFIILLIVLSISIYITARLLPGANIQHFVAAIPVAILLSLFNILLKPLLVFLTIPITILTLGLFIFVINGLIIWWTSKLVKNFSIKSFGWAILFSLVLSVIQSVIEAVIF